MNYLVLGAWGKRKNSACVGVWGWRLEFCNGHKKANLAHYCISCPNFVIIQALKAIYKASIATASTPDVNESL